MKHPADRFDVLWGWVGLALIIFIFNLGGGFFEVAERAFAGFQSLPALLVFCWLLVSLLYKVALMLKVNDSFLGNTSLCLVLLGVGLSIAASGIPPLNQMADEMFNKSFAALLPGLIALIVLMGDMAAVTRGSSRKTGIRR